MLMQRVLKADISLSTDLKLERLAERTRKKRLDCFYARVVTRYLSLATLPIIVISTAGFASIQI